MSDSNKTISRQAYADMFGPTTGDLVQLGDTDLWLEVERDLDAIVVRMSEFGDLRGLIQLMREIKRRQEGLREDTRSQTEKDGAGGKEE